MQNFTEKKGGRSPLDRPLNPPLILRSRTSGSRFKSTSPGRRGVGGTGVPPHKRLMGMCRWGCGRIVSTGLTISIQLLEWGRSFSDFWGKTVLHI